MPKKSSEIVRDSRRRNPHLLAAAMVIAASFSLAACSDDAKRPDNNGWIVSESFAAKGATAEGLPEVGTRISDGMRIATAKGQFLHIQDGRSQVIISAGTTVTISDTKPGTDGPYLDLASGSLAVKPIIYGKPGRTMAVNTPHVVVIIHGSAVGITASPEQSLVHVSEGVATVANMATGKSEVVSAHKMAIATQDGIEIK
jgi:hypothetical protein